MCGARGDVSGGREKGNERDKLAAFATLYDVLVTFSQVLAPVLPFITEEIYQGLVQDESVSVHHTDYPKADTTVIDHDLESAMAVVRQIVTLGRSLRSQQSIGVRQPLATLTVLTQDAAVEAAVDGHKTIISEELNVKAVVTSSDVTALVVLSAKANFRTLGPRMGSEVKALAMAIEGLDAASVERLVETGQLTVDGVDLSLDDVIISRDPLPGVVVASDGPLSVALDLELTDELRGEGVAREVVSNVQQLRRDLDLQVSDRITLRWHSTDEGLVTAIETHAAFIASEILATEMIRGAQPEGSFAEIGTATLTLAITGND